MTEKSTKGRKPLPDQEKKVPVTVWVKLKNAEIITRECIKIQNKHDKN
jgi:hypothetical protein